MIGRLISAAAEAVRGDVRPATTPGLLRPIDTDGIARLLKIEEKGRERGTQERPDSSAVGLDTVEQEIVQKIESEWSWQGGELINNLRAYVQRLVACSVDAEFSRLDVQANNTLARLRAASHRAGSELGPLREHYVATRDELADFKRHHRLTRVARQPAHRWIAFGLLAFLVAVESALNGFFFAKGNEDGLLGGIGTAIGVSLVNVVIAFLVGFGPARWLNHRHPIARGIGFLFLLAGVCGLVALHAFAAHFRDVTAALGEERAMMAAIAALQIRPWALADIQSYYLFGLGLLFAAGAIYKGYTLDDPYPLYGRTARRAEDARLSYSDEHNDLFDELAAIKEETIRRLDEGLVRLPTFPQQAADIRAQRAALIEQFRAYETSARGAANNLLERYREANRQGRTSSAPAHFSVAWQLPYSFLESTESRTLIAAEDKDTLSIHSALESLRKLSKDVLDEYQKLILTYPHPTAMS